MHDVLYPISEVDKSPVLKPGVFRGINRKVVLVLAYIKPGNTLIHLLSQHYSVRFLPINSDGETINNAYCPDAIVVESTSNSKRLLEFIQRINVVFDRAIPVFIIANNYDYRFEIEAYKVGVVDFIRDINRVDVIHYKIQNILRLQEQRVMQQEQFRRLSQPELKTESPDKIFMDKIKAAINDHLDEPGFDVKTLSKSIGIGENLIYRKIKTYTGQTTVKFIRNQRLKIAAKMLKQNECRIFEVMYMVGFSSPSYFTLCFKNYFGLTPTEFACKHRHDDKSDEQLA